MGHAEVYITLLTLLLSEQPKLLSFGCSECYRVKIENLIFGLGNDFL